MAAPRKYPDELRESALRLAGTDGGGRRVEATASTAGDQRRTTSKPVTTEHRPDRSRPMTPALPSETDLVVCRPLRLRDGAADDAASTRLASRDARRVRARSVASASADADCGRVDGALR